MPPAFSALIDLEDKRQFLTHDIEARFVSIEAGLRLIRDEQMRWTVVAGTAILCRQIVNFFGLSSNFAGLIPFVPKKDDVTMERLGGKNLTAADVLADREVILRGMSVANQQVASITARGLHHPLRTASREEGRELFDHTAAFAECVLRVGRPRVAERVREITEALG